MELKPDIKRVEHFRLSKSSLNKQIGLRIS